MTIAVISRASLRPACDAALETLVRGRPDLVLLYLGGERDGDGVPPGATRVTGPVGEALAALAVEGRRPVVVAPAADLLAAFVGQEAVVVRTRAVLVGLAADPVPGGADAVDLLRLGALPGGACAQPADDAAVAPILAALLAHPGPGYLRLPAGAPVRLAVGPVTFGLGQSAVVLAGDDVTVAATGAAVGETLLAALELQAEGIHPRVVDVASLRPLDIPGLLRHAAETAGLLTVEDHGGPGGLAASLDEAPGADAVPRRGVVLADAAAQEPDRPPEAGEALNARGRLIRAAVTAFVHGRRR
jgi:deoxyxylulose-5-phosphate synthase